MAFSIETAYGIGRQALKLAAAALARTLTNNPATSVVSALDTEAANTVTLLGGTTLLPTQAVVADGSAITIGGSTYTFTVVAGAITNIAVS